MTGSPRPARDLTDRARPALRYSRVVLLGFMGSGKTAVGRRLAARLRWKHIDLDKEIERHTGSIVADIFAQDGEAAFRALEAELTPRFAAMNEVVLSPGGGWATNPALLDDLPLGTLTVWLKISAAEVLRRVASTGTNVRPLLAGADPTARVEALLAEREGYYQRADISVETDGRRIGSIVEELAEIIRTGSAASTGAGRSS